MPTSLRPEKRPRVTFSPTLVTKDGELYIDLSTPGGDNQDQALLQVLLNIIEFGMTPQEAVEAPRFQTEHFYASFGFHEFAAGRVSLEGRLSRDTIQKLDRARPSRSSRRRVEQHLGPRGDPKKRRCPNGRGGPETRPVHIRQIAVVYPLPDGRGSVTADRREL